MINNLKYPIGQAQIPATISQHQIDVWIAIIELFPKKLEALTKNLSEEQLNTPYRPEGWTIRQVIHHCADSHQHSYTRFKWALTENESVIKAYYEDRWAELSDKNAPIFLSINVLKALHEKWVYFLRSLSTEDFTKHFIHPSGNKKVLLSENIGIYAWHCEHHYAHIFNLLKTKAWI